MLAWEKLIFNIDLLMKLFIIFVIIYVVLSAVFQYLIKRNKIKPSKISRIFYYDNKGFIKFWEKYKEKGMFKYIIKNTIQITIIMGIWGILFKLNKQGMFGYEQSKTVFIALIMGVILGLILSLMGWVTYNNRYKKLKEK